MYKQCKNQTEFVIACFYMRLKLCKHREASTLSNKVSNLIATLCFLLILVSFEVYAKENEDKIYQIRSVHLIQMFSHPTVHSRVVCKLPAGDHHIKLAGKKNYSSSKWQKISWGNKTGWVQAQLLVLVESPGVSKLAAN